MSQRFVAGRGKKTVAEAELASFRLDVHLPDDGDVAGDTEHEIADDEAVELGDRDPAGMIFNRGRPVSDRRLLRKQRGAAALIGQVMARRSFELSELCGVGGDG